MPKILHDNGGRRLKIDRRQFSYDFHIPERGLAKIEEAGRIEDENQECQNSENNLNRRRQQWLYLLMFE